MVMRASYLETMLKCRYIGEIIHVILMFAIYHMQKNCEHVHS